MGDSLATSVSTIFGADLGLPLDNFAFWRTFSSNGRGAGVTSMASSNMGALAGRPLDRRDEFSPIRDGRTDRPHDEAVGQNPKRIPSRVDVLRQ